MICDLCPRHCRKERDCEKPETFCGMPGEPVIARAGLHFWEEPCISGERGSGTVFFSGCNLKCVFCQNYNISTCKQGIPVTLSRLKEIYQELIRAGAHNINLVTPAHYANVITESLDTPLAVPVVWNSNGYDSVETLDRLAGKIQIYMPDLKYADDALARKYSNAPDYFAIACAAIDRMYEQVGPFEFDDDGMLKRGVLIRHLILPGCIDNSLQIIDYIRRRFAPHQVLFGLMRQYVPCGVVSAERFSELNRKISDLEYDIVENALFESGIEDGFVQEADAASTEFIPDFNGFGVRN